MSITKTPLRRVYTIGFIFSLSMAFTAYINSTFLEQMFSSSWVSFLFSAGALLSLVMLELLPILLGRYGVRNTASGILVISMLSLFALSQNITPWITGLCFVLYITTNSLMTYCFDIFIEHFTTNNKVGNSRGTYLTVVNLAWMLSPFIAGVVIATYGFNGLYMIVLVFIAITTVLKVLFFTNFKDSKYKRPSPLKALKYIEKHVGIERIIIVNFILQFFYAWMIIFTPIYLHQVIGFDFATIGIIFTVMLAPFVLFQFPLGRLADNGWGEKRFLIFGIIVMMLATMSFGLYHGSSAIIFAIILFFTRVGASIVEIMTETYFFKKTSDKETNIISLFRTAPPLAFIIAPLIGTLILAISSYTSLFLILSIIIFVALIITIPLHDTR